jgi:hypothetical protein
MARLKKPQKKKGRKVGKPSIKTPKLIDRMLIAIREGNSLTKVCKEILKIDLSIVYEWLKKDEQFAKDYARACEDRADTKNDQISEIINKIETGELKPDAGRVMIDAIKWQAAHERPKRYGDRVDVTSGNEPLQGATALTSMDVAVKIAYILRQAAEKKPLEITAGENEPS